MENYTAKVIVKKLDGNHEIFRKKMHRMFDVSSM